MAACHLPMLSARQRSAKELLLWPDLTRNAWNLREIASRRESRRRLEMPAEKPIQGGRAPGSHPGGRRFELGELQPAGRGLLAGGSARPAGPQTGPPTITFCRGGPAITKRPTGPAVGRFTRQTTAKCRQTWTSPDSPRQAKALQIEVSQTQLHTTDNRGVPVRVRVSPSKVPESRMFAGFSIGLFPPFPPLSGSSGAAGVPDAPVIRGRARPQGRRRQRRR